MKQFIALLILVSMLLGACTQGQPVPLPTTITPPKTVTTPAPGKEFTPRPTNQPHQISMDGGKVLDGSWTYDCVKEFGVGEYHWKANEPLHFKNLDVDVEAMLDDLDAEGDFPSPLAFIVYKHGDEDGSQWLYINDDGTADPELEYFDRIGPMETYPGGYPAFEKDLKTAGIDWVKTYQKVKAEFMLMYLQNVGTCLPPHQSNDSQA